MPYRKWQGKSLQWLRAGQTEGHSGQCCEVLGHVHHCYRWTGSSWRQGPAVRRHGVLLECASHCLDSEGPFGYIQRLDGEARRLVF